MRALVRILGPLSDSDVDEINFGSGVTRRYAGCLIVTAEDPQKAAGFAAAPKTSRCRNLQAKPMSYFASRAGYSRSPN
jgi:hypothetical protein